MSIIKSLNSTKPKIVRKSKNSGQRESFFGKSFQANETQFDVDATAQTGPYLAKVIYIYNEDNGQRIDVGNGPGSIFSNIVNFFGLGGDSSPKVLMVKARMVDSYDAAIPEPARVGKKAVNLESQGTKPDNSAIFIELHDNFMAVSEEANSLSLKVGDLIIVDYMDKKNKKNGYIISKHFSAETEAGEGLEGEDQSVLDTLANIAKGVVSSVTGLGTSGRCGKVYEETDCKTGTIKISGVFGPYTSSQYAELSRKLDKLKNYKYCSVESYEIDNSSSTDSNSIKVKVVYNYTKVVSLTGHPNFIDLVKAQMMSAIVNYQNLNDPITPAALLIGSSYRSKEEQIALRRSNCKGLSESDLMTASSTQCDPHTAPPGYSMHERGEALDFFILDLEEFEKSGKLQLISNSMSNLSKHQKQKLRAYLANNPYVDVSRLQRAKAQTYGNKVDASKQTFIPLATEGWHFSTNGK